MIKKIVSSSEPITLIGGGVVTDSDLKMALSVASSLVAADGGANHAIAAGVTPHAVIGDLDSISPDVRAVIPSDRVWHIAEQDSTDFEKSLQRIEAPLIIGLGFGGGRLDHQLAAFHTLLRFAAQPCILLMAGEVVCLAPPRLSLPMAQQDIVSLFPMLPTQGQSTGLQWPIDDLTFAPGQRIATSNTAIGGLVTMAFDQPGMLMILPRATFPDLVQAVRAAPSWPDAVPVHA